MNIIENKNRKLVFLTIISLTMLLAIFSFSQTSHAATNGESTNNYPMDKELQKANDLLDSMTEEANEKLEEGKENFIIEEKIEGSDDSVKLGFSSIKDNKILNSTQEDLPFAAQPKDFSAFVGMSAFGFGFEHNLNGTFTYSSGNIKGVTKKVDLTGWAYAKSHNTYVDNLDPSVRVVNSTGTFDALKFFKQYKTHLKVRLLGSGHYEITQAEVTN